MHKGKETEYCLDTLSVKLDGVKPSKALICSYIFLEKLWARKFSCFEFKILKN
ncbi:hypothetical protein SLEP1_g57381 [Rubroshorea leprosula]|uniref:Uncharacterized protein n=1 Tax=Rubroshorea leprosula TaxID=152421 RepID=A0AAV5MMS0_9ROSI|nr:hypothetical protein SLEP1_g57381 [Rubroshorea leprosula]